MIYMKYWLEYFLTIACLSIVFTFILWFVSPPTLRSAEFYTPLPDSLIREYNSQVTNLELWLPSVEKTHASEQVHLTARAALTFELGKNKAIFEKNTKERMPMASLTKIMTAIVALENPAIGNKYTVPKEALVGENTMGLEEGEILTIDDLLYGIFLHSANDATEVLAANFPGGRTAFIQAMNNKAKALGLTDTNFTNPSGLQGDGNQYTTAYDLLVITKYLIENFPKVVPIASAPEYYLPETRSHKGIQLYNETNLITTYPGVKGLKTGYTPEAGLCLITYYEDQGQKLVGIILGSENRRQEMKDLLDYSLTSLGTTPPKHN